MQKNKLIIACVTSLWLLQLATPVLAEPLRDQSESQATSAQKEDGLTSAELLIKYQTANRQGFMDAINQKPMTPPDQEPFKTAYCTGYRDGQAALANAKKQINQQQISAEPTPNNEPSEPTDQTPASEADIRGSIPANNPDPDVNQVNNEVDAQNYGRLTPTPNQKQFIAHVGPIAQKVAQNHDLYASVMIAQAALESNWGSSQLSRIHHNLFGVKGSFNGQSVSMTTNECQANGQPIVIAGNFKSYPSEQASLTDYAFVLDQPMYANVHRQVAKNYRVATHNLTGKYATDPHYAQKLDQIIDAYGLTRFDRPVINKVTTTHQKAKPDRLTKTPKFKPAPQQTKANQRPSSHSWLPVASGIGGVGMLEVLRRIYG